MTARASAPVTATVVHSRGCHFCEDALAALAELAGDHRLRVELVAAESESGRRLVAEHRPPLFPLVLIDGVFFSFGRLPRRKLRKVLDTRAAAAVA